MEYDPEDLDGFAEREIKELLTNPYVSKDTTNMLLAAIYNELRNQSVLLQELIGTVENMK